MIVASGLKFPNQDRQTQTSHEGQRKFDAIMGMKLYFREEIAGSDAKKSPRSKRKRDAQYGAGLGSGLVDAREKQGHSAGYRQSKQTIDEVTGVLRFPARRHQRANGHGIKWLVQQNDEKRAHSLGDSVGAVGISVNARRQGQTVKK